MSKQNIYDNPTFFYEYKKLRDDELSFNKLIEQPLIQSLLPDLKDILILDLGCGFGEFCRYAAKSGAKRVVGVDISKKMLQVAEAKTHDDKISYINQPIEEFNSNEHFDIVVSSLAFHYIKDLEAVFSNMMKWLKPKGRLVFSVEHPICTANYEAITTQINNHELWVIKNYRDELPFKQKWFVDDVIKYHRKFDTYFNLLIGCGFSIDKVLEPMPSDAQIEEHASLQIHCIRPPLLVFSCKKLL